MLGLLQIGLTAAQPLFRLSCGRDVGYRPDKLEMAGCIDRRARQHVHLLHRAVRHKQPVFVLEILVVAAGLIHGPLHVGPIIRMGARDDELWRRRGRRIASENSKCLRCPDDLAGGDLPAEAAGVAQFLGVSEIGLALLQGMFGALAFGDVFAGDQNNELVAGAPHGLRVLANPQDRAVLPDLLDFPSVRLTYRLQADRNAFANKLAVFLAKDVEYGRADELRNRIAELHGTKRIHVHHRAIRADHEIHDRIVLEDLPPFPFAVAQFNLAVPEFGFGRKRGLLFQARVSGEPRHDRSSHAEGGYHDDMLRIVDDETQGRGSKEKDLARGRQKAKQDCAREVAEQREREDQDQIGERGRGETGFQHKTNQGDQCQPKAAEEELRG